MTSTDTTERLSSDREGSSTFPGASPDAAFESSCAVKPSPIQLASSSQWCFINDEATATQDQAIKQSIVEYDDNWGYLSLQFSAIRSAVPSSYSLSTPPESPNVLACLIGFLFLVSLVFGRWSNRRLKYERDELIEEFEDYKIITTNQINDLKDDIEAHKRLKAKSDERCEDLQTDLDNMETERDLANGELQELRTDVQNQVLVISKQESRIKTLSQEKAQLKRLFAEAVSSNNAKDSRVNALEDLLSRKDEVIKRLSEDMEQAVQEHQRSTHELHEQIAELVKQRDESSELITQLRGQAIDLFQNVPYGDDSLLEDLSPTTPGSLITDTPAENALGIIVPGLGPAYDGKLDESIGDDSMRAMLDGVSIDEDLY